MKTTRKTDQAEGVHLVSCQKNLKQIVAGINQYRQDHDGKFPSAKNWIDDLLPYVKSEALFNCPSLSKKQRYGYAFNLKLSNKTGMGVFETSQTVAIYETIILKRNSYGTGENLAFRHHARNENGANYAFADGHVKWFPKTQTPSFKLKP